MIRALVYLLPFSMIIEIPLVGRLFATDVLCVVLIPLLSLRTSSRKTSPGELHFYIFAFLWLAGAILSDLYRDMPFEDYARGWAMIFFSITNFTALRLLIGKDMDKAVLVVFLLFAANALRTALGIGDVDFSGDLLGSGWKFGYGAFAISASLLAGPLLTRNRLPSAVAAPLPFVTSLLSLVANARNLFAISLLAAVAGHLIPRWKRGLSRSKLAGVVVAMGVASAGAYNLYSYAAGDGLLGFEAQRKYEIQTQGSLGLLLSGRVEMLASTQAIVDSPLIGHGSWMNDVSYIDMLVARLESAGVRPPDEVATWNRIPSHSCLFGSWVENGVFGGLFWIWALWIVVRGVYAAIRCPSPYTGFAVFVGVLMIWDIFFSPFGLERRVTVPASLYLLMLAAERNAMSERGRLARQAVRV
jgi:hypothetical protein